MKRRGTRIINVVYCQSGDRCPGRVVYATRISDHKGVIEWHYLCAKHESEANDGGFMTYPVVHAPPLRSRKRGGQ